MEFHLAYIKYFICTIGNETLLNGPNKHDMA